MTRAKRIAAANYYFGSDLRHTPLVLGSGMEESELQIWRHAGHNDACALHVNPGKADQCFIFDEPAQIEDLIAILQGMLDAVRGEQDA